MDLKKRKLMRLGGSLVVALDPEFLRNAEMAEGDDVYIIADKKVLLITHDEREAKALNNELHDFAYQRLRQRGIEDKTTEKTREATHE